jgi:hypothetical protein
VLQAGLEVCGGILLEGVGTREVEEVLGGDEVLGHVCAHESAIHVGESGEGGHIEGEV